jgi:hypothetical protein
MFLLAGYDEKYQPTGENAELPSGYQHKRGHFNPFSLKRSISVYIFLKSQKSHQNFKYLFCSFPNILR